MTPGIAGKAWLKIAKSIDFSLLLPNLSLAGYRSILD
jgi:hypothetical protein